MFNTVPYKKQRKQFAIFELRHRVLNSIIKNKTLKPALRWYCQTKNSQKIKNKSKVRFKNRCVFSGRSRSFYRFVKMSRLFLRDNAFIDKIPGLRKSYW